MPELRKKLNQKSLDYDRVVIGGPGVYLTLHYYSDFLDGIEVEVRDSYPGVLQIINPHATRSTLGCINGCGFCGIGQGIIEPGGFQELPDWPDLPILIDNNLLASSQSHFDKVIDRLIRHRWADFEQGLDPRLLTGYHAQRIAEIKNPTIRLALDSAVICDAWLEAFSKLRKAGIAKYNIRSYALIGLDSGPEEAWSRCQWIESFGIKVLPMWYHRLDALKHNIVTKEQAGYGWTDYERRRIMQWFYQHKEAVRI